MLGASIPWGFPTLVLTRRRALYLGGEYGTVPNRIIIPHMDRHDTTLEQMTALNITVLQ